MILKSKVLDETDDGDRIDPCFGIGMFSLRAFAHFLVFAIGFPLNQEIVGSMFIVERQGHGAVAYVNFPYGCESRRYVFNDYTFQCGWKVILT